jgi:hypothetical protein
MIDLSGSLGISTTCSTLIAARLFLMHKQSAGQSQPLIHFWKAATILLESGPVLAPIGAIAVWLRKDMHEIVFLTPGPFESLQCHARYLSHFMDALRIHSLVSALRNLVGHFLIQFRSSLRSSCSSTFSEALHRYQTRSFS